MQNIQGALIKNLIWFSIFRLETMYNFRLYSGEVRAVVLYTVWVWCILVLSQKSQTRTHVRMYAQVFCQFLHSPLFCSACPFASDRIAYLNFAVSKTPVGVWFVCVCVRAGICHNPK